MLIREIFDTKIEETIDPVIRVAERQDENALLRGLACHDALEDPREGGASDRGEKAIAN